MNHFSQFNGSLKKQKKAKKLLKLILSSFSSIQQISSVSKDLDFIVSSAADLI